MDPPRAASYVYFSIFDHQGVISSCAWLYVTGVVSDRGKDNKSIVRKCPLKPCAGIHLRNDI